MWFLLWVVLDVVLSTILEFLLEVTRVLDSEKQARGLAVVCLAFLGLVFGVVSGFLVPLRIFPAPRRAGLSVVVVPTLLAGSMAVWGAMRRGRHLQVSHLATWYGGAALGLGLALGRLGALSAIGA